MPKLLYKGQHEIKGQIEREIDNIVEIKLDAGGYMMLSKGDVSVLPTKEEKKEAKKAYKKENDSTESEG